MTDARRRQIFSVFRAPEDGTGTEPASLGAAPAAPGAGEEKPLFGVDPLQVVDTYCRCLARWSDEPLRLADFIA